MTEKLKINETIGFIGAGNMAQAIAFRLLTTGVIDPSNIIVSAPSDKNLKIWRDKNVQTTNDNYDVVLKSKYAFLAVKPQYFNECAESLRNTDDRPRSVQCFVSVMAGRSISLIKQTLGPSYATVGVVRVMPNTPCLVGLGCSVMCHESTVDQRNFVKQIMLNLGTVNEVAENMFNSVSGLCGSGPAYMYLVMEALADGAVQEGVPRDMAINMAANVMKGAAEMVLQTNKHPGLLKDEVCSPGGTTIAGIAHLEQSSIRAAFIGAIQAAASRGAELSKMG